MSKHQVELGAMSGLVFRIVLGILISSTAFGAGNASKTDDQIAVPREAAKEVKSARWTLDDPEKEVADRKAEIKKKTAAASAGSEESLKATASAQERAAVPEKQAPAIQQAKANPQTETGKASDQVAKPSREAKEVESLRKTLAAREKEVADLKAGNKKEIAALGAKNEESLKAIVAAQESAAVLEKQAQAGKEKERELSGQIAELKKQVQAIQQEKANLQAETGKASDQTAKLSRDAKEVESLRKTLAAREKTISELQAAHDVQKIRFAGQIDDLEKRLLSSVGRIASQETQLTEECGKARDLSRKVAALDERLKEEALCRQGKVVRKKPLQQDDPCLAMSLNDVGLVFAAQGQYDQAIPLYRNALSILETTVGKEHPSVAGVVENLADVLRNKKDFAGAASLYRRALSTAERVYGKEDLKVALLANELGFVCKEQEQYAEAEALYKRGIHIIENARGKNDPLVAGILNNYATMCLSQDRFADAGSLLGRAVKVIESAGGDQLSMIVILQNMAHLYELTGRNQLAQQCTDKARRLLGSATKSSLNK